MKFGSRNPKIRWQKVADRALPLDSNSTSECYCSRLAPEVQRVQAPLKQPGHQSPQLLRRFKIRLFFFFKYEIYISRQRDSDIWRIENIRKSYIYLCERPENSISHLLPLCSDFSSDFHSSLVLTCVLLAKQFSGLLRRFHCRHSGPVANEISFFCFRTVQQTVSRVCGLVAQILKNILPKREHR